MPSKTRRRLVALALVAGLMCLTLALFLSRWPLSRPPLPDPNGYDDFLKASKAIVEDLGSSYSTLDRDRLREVVSANAAALRLLRLGLTRQCWVPTDSALTNDVTRAGLSSVRRSARAYTPAGAVWTHAPYPH